ncbi:hypothetical protein KC19_2G213700 [Ceratodon purpureus]|uniref:Uncharacterized protein n=1 Tax=Ceratodon purpureus TaxID=3225 RepID=A0A8T0IYK5_CERPU|nr:hypothetical protein KC19_2G213700 [Ceratodon purpureus]
MALSNFLLTVAAVGAGFVLLKGDVRRSAVNLRRNLKHVRTWLEQEQASSGSASKGHVKPKEVESGTSEKVPMKEEKH